MRGIARWLQAAREARSLTALVVLLSVALLATPAAAVAATPAADCQPFAEPCLLPFPNNLFTKPDPTSATGLRVDLPQAAMPANTNGVPVGVAPYDRSDGFSPGSSIIARVPGLDNQAAFDQTDPVRLTDMSQAFAPDAPIVVIDAATGQRALIWAELDSNAGDPQHTTLLIHPGKNLTEGHRYIVALRDLKDANGKALKAPTWFARLRDEDPLPSEQDQVDRYNSIFRSLKNAGIKRSGLYEAWDFTVASSRSLASPMLSIRNDAFGQLGDTNLSDLQVQGNAPQFQVTSVQDFTPDQNPRLLREVLGTFTVPCYLTTPTCSIGGSFHYGSTNPDATPTQVPGNTGTAQFDCIIPRAAEGAAARASLYGHGLLGSRTEVHAGNVQDMAAEHDFVFCATDWWGLASADTLFDISALRDINRFPAVADRLQQGVLNTLLLGRLLANPSGLASNAAFQQNGSPLIDTSHLYYDGNSQGGIMGGITTAVAPDYTRAVLGVTGMDYGGVLLQRSTDFTQFAAFLYGQQPGGGYTDPSIHPLVLDLMQQLWDRGEADAYAAHMTSAPLPDTPAHQVLMQTAYGDHQVSQYAAAVEARTIGAQAHQPALDLPARSQDVNLFYGIPAIQGYPFDGSAWVIWDDGPGLVSPPPLTNTPPSTSGHDPHGDVRATVAARTQKSDFLEPNGAVVDVCGGLPCHTDVFAP
jgi:hypothetical protein